MGHGGNPYLCPVTCAHEILVSATSHEENITPRFRHASLCREIHADLSNAISVAPYGNIFLSFSGETNTHIQGIASLLYFTCKQC